MGVQGWTVEELDYCSDQVVHVPVAATARQLLPLSGDFKPRALIPQHSNSVNHIDVSNLD